MLTKRLAIFGFCIIGIFLFLAIAIRAENQGNSYFNFSMNTADLNINILTQSELIPFEVCNLQNKAQVVFFETIASRIPFDIQIWEKKQVTNNIAVMNQTCNPFIEYINNGTFTGNFTNPNCTISYYNSTETSTNLIPFTKTILAPNKKNHRNTTQNQNTCKDFYYKIVNIPANKKGQTQYNITIFDDENNSLLIDPWFNNSWNNKRQINISGDIPMNYTLLVEIAKPDGMNATCTDARFVNSTEDGELGYWLDPFPCNSTTLKAYVRIDNNNSIYLYYNNTAANTTSKMRDAFLIGDDFDDGLKVNISDEIGWASLSVINGELVGTGNADNNWWFFNNSLNFPNYTIYAKGKMTINGYSLLFNTNRVIGSGYRWDMNRASSAIFHYNLSAFGAGSSINQTTFISLYDTYYNFTLKINGSIINYTTTNSNDSINRNFTYMVDDTHRHNATNNVMGVRGSTGAAGEHKVTTDYFYVKPMLTPEPTLTIGGSTSSADTSNPSLNITYPRNLSYNINVSVLNYTVSDDNLQACWFSSNNGLTNTTITCGINMSGVNSTQGSNTWRIYVNDSSNNKNETNVTFVVDTIAPDINITYPRNITYAINVSWLNYTVSTEAQSCRFSLDNGVTNVTIKCGTNISTELECYQETANKSTECGGLSTGIYAPHVGGGNCNNFYDEDWDSSISSGDDCLVNYTKPNRALNNSVWQVKDGTWSNLSIPIDCWNYDVSKIVLRGFYEQGSGNAYWYCRNNTDWKTLKTQAGSIKGESIIWNLSVSSASSNTWRIYTNDSAGNNNQSNVTFVVSIDTIAPNINITYPRNLSYNINVSVLNYTVSDDNLQACWFSSNNGLTNQTITCGVNMSGVNSTQGSNTWRIYVNDSSNNKNETNVTFIVDTIAPDVNITYPLNATYNINVSILNYTISTEAQSCRFSSNNGLTNLTITCGVNMTGVNSTQGSNTWRLYINDSAGNNNQSNVTFVVDTIAPNVNITYPRNISYAINVSWLNYTVSTEAQSCRFSSNNGLNNLTITCGVNMSGVNSTQGSNTWRIYVNDSSNNKNETNVTFVIDTIAPDINITYPRNTTYTYIVNHLNYTVSDTNLQSCWYSTDNGATNYSTTCGINITPKFLCYQETANISTSCGGLSNGTYFWEGADMATVPKIYDNNWSSSYSSGGGEDSIIYFNYTKPTNANNNTLWQVGDDTGVVNLTIPSSCWNYSNEKISLRVRLLGLNHTNWTCFNGNWSQLRFITVSKVYEEAIGWDFSINASEGSNTWLIGTNDSVGNSNFSRTTFTQSTGFPSISIIIPSNNSNHSTRLVNINFTVTNEQACWYSNNSGLVNRSINCALNITNQSWNEGTNNVTIYVNDSIGNLNSSSVTFIVDTIAPNVNITYPRNLSYNINISWLNYTVSTEAQSCRFSSNNGLNNQTITCGVNMTGVNSTQGSNTWRIYVNDSVNNINQSNVTFVVDTIAPDINITYPRNISYAINVSWLNYTVSTEAQSCRFSSNNGLNNQTITCGVNMTGVNSTQGTNTWRIYVNDSVNNINESNVTFVIDTIAPDINITYPLNTTYLDYYNYSIWLNTTQSDSGVGIQTKKYSINNGLTNITFTGNVSVAGLSAGGNIIRVWVNDSVGNQNQSNVTFAFVFTPKIDEINISNTSTSYSRTDLQNGLVGWWKFDKNWTNQEDSSINSNNGTVINNASFINEGKIGGAYNFTNNRSYVEINAGYLKTVNYGQPMTYSLWIKLNVDSFNWFLAQTLISSNTSFIHIRDSDNRIYMRYDDTSGARVSTYVLGTGDRDWHHIVGYYDGFNKTELYVDGIFRDADNFTGVGNSSVRNIGYIGRRETGYFNGSIDEVRIYNRSLSASEISQLYSITNPTFQEYANVTINATITDEDTPQANLFYRWIVNGVEQLVGFAQGIFNYIFNLENQKVELYVNDTNNYTAYQEWNITTSFINPSLNITYPLNKTYNTIITILNYTTSDINLQACWYSLNNGLTNTTITCGNNVSGLNSGQGSSIWRIWSNDSVNNINQSNVTFFVDSLTPNINITYPLNITYFINVTSLNYTVSDTNLNTCWFSSNNGLTNQTLVCGVNITGANSSEGTNTWRIYVNDSLNNINQSNVTFVKNTSAPVVTLISPQNNTLSENFTHIFSCNASSSNTIINSSLYLWNSSKINIFNITNLTSNTAITINFSYNFTYYNNYEWNCLFYDNNSVSSWGTNNFTLKILNNKTTINNFSSIPGPLTLKLGDRFKLQVNVSVGNNTELVWCNFTLRHESGLYYLNNINGTKMNNGIWNSTNILINKTGIFNASINCLNNYDVNSSQTLTLNSTYTLTYSPSENYLFAARVEKNETRSFNISLFDDSVGNITYNLTYFITNLSLFNITLTNYSLILNASDNSTNNFISTLTLNASSGITNGTYDGNITITNTTYNLSYMVNFSYSINPPAGEPSLYNSTNGEFCSKLLTSTCSNVLSVNRDSITTTSYYIKNTGAYRLKSCHPKFTDLLNARSWVMFNNNSFDLAINETSNLVITFSPDASAEVKNYDGYFYVSCDDGDLASGNISTDPNNRPYNIISVSYAIGGQQTGTPSGGTTAVAKLPAEPFICTEKDVVWSVQSDVGTQYYDFFIAPGGTRDRILYLYNNGNKSVNLFIKCKDEIEDRKLCKYMTIGEDNITLLPLRTPKEISLNLDLSLSNYSEDEKFISYLEIGAADTCLATFTISATITKVGIILSPISMIDKLFRQSFVLKLSAMSNKLDNINIPYYLVTSFVFISILTLFRYLFFRELKYKWMYSSVLSLLISFIIFIMI